MVLRLKFNKLIENGIGVTENEFYTLHNIERCKGFDGSRKLPLNVIEIEKRIGDNLFQCIKNDWKFLHFIVRMALDVTVIEIENLQIDLVVL